MFKRRDWVPASKADEEDGGDSSDDSSSSSGGEEDDNDAVNSGSGQCPLGLAYAAALCGCHLRCMHPYNINLFVLTARSYVL